MLKKLVPLLVLITVSLHAQTPGSISNDLRLWLKADSGTNTVINGTGITNWNDQSTNGFNATGTGKAVYNTSNLINYNPTISFTDDPQPITGTINRPNGVSSTVFVVGSVSQIASRKAIVEFGQGGNNRQMFFNNTYSLGMSYILNTSNSNIWTISDQGALLNTTINQNGLEIGSASPRTGNFLTSWTNGNFFLGDDATGGDRLTGEIAEVIYYDNQLSEADTRKVETYLAIKYGITQDNSLGNEDGDYILSNDFVLWDALDNSTYHNNIVAIGRDDNSSLEQKKSTGRDSVLTLEKTTSFVSNLDFVIVGDDGASFELANGNTPPGIVSKSQRTWSVKTSGTPGSISVSFELGADIINSGEPTDYELIIDNDTDFTNATTHTTGVSIIGNTLTFSDVNLNDGDFFTLATNGLSSSPGYVASGIVSWFKADAITSLSDGANILQWNNSINNKTTHATQAGSSDFPTYQENIHNFNPSTYFNNGDNGYFNVDLNEINNTNYNVIAIVERENTFNENYFIGTNASVNNEGLFLGYKSNNTLTFGQFNNDLDLVVNIFDSPQRSTALIRTELNGSLGKTVQELRDATLKETTNTQTDFLTGNNQGVIGRGFGNEGFNGYVSEIILYNNLLTNSDLTKIYSYLAIKYGITLDESDGITNGDYQNSNASVIWDQSENNVYQNEIIGIGRDDKSALVQLKSKEPSTSSIELTIEKKDKFTHDQDFILIGNDNGLITTTTNGINTSFLNRVERTWKAQVSGKPGTTNINFTIGGSIPNTGNAYDYAILIDNDTDFSNANVFTNGVSLDGNTLSFTDVNLKSGDIFTLAVESINQGPGDVIGNLMLWLKADTGTNTITNQGSLTSWSDQSGQFSNATGTGEAKYKENTLNNNPSIEFFNTAKPIEGVMARNKGEGSTIFMVQKSSPLSSVGIDAFGDFNNSSSNRQYFFESRYATTSGNTFSILENQVSILTIDDPGTMDMSNIYENGLFLTTNTKSTNSSWSGVGAYQIGDDLTGGNEFTGEIAEVLYYDRELSSTERQKIESYLAIKYGITLDNSTGGVSGDYIISDNTIIWDAEDNVNYHNNLFAIGRDDNSFLNQLKSKSENPDSFIEIEKSGSFANDQSFIIIGSNNQSLLPSETNHSPSYSHRIDKVWNVHTKGTTGSIDISFYLDEQNIYNSEVIGDYALLIDTDTNFSSGAIEHTSGANISNGVLTFTNVTLTNNNFITLAIENPTVPFPGGISTDLSLWLKSDKGTNTTDNGVGITSWVDQSRNTANATGTGLATYDTSKMINYNPTISFTNDAQPISGNFSRSTGVNSTFFVVANINEENTTSRMGIVEFTNNPHTGDTRQIFFTDQYFPFINPAGINFETSKLWTIEDKDISGNINLYENNNLVGSSTNTTTRQYTSGQYFIGDDQTGGDRLTGRISEVIYYDATLSIADKQKVESYLAIKYGITLNGNYVNSHGSTIWDSTTNSMYHNNIAAIGQDKDSDLYQKQSKSESTDGILTIALGNVAESNITNTNEFDDDLDFLLWGNNSTDNVVSLIDNGIASGDCAKINKKIDRDWKILNIGSVGAVTLSFDMSTLPNPLDYSLNIDNDGDGDFETGMVTVNSSGTLNGSHLVFSNITLDNGVVFTLTKDTALSEIIYFNGTWSGGSGTNGMLSIADIDKSVDIISNVTLTENAQCNCMNVFSGTSLTVPTNSYLKVVNKLELNGDIYLEGTSELIQTGETNTNTNTVGKLHKILNEATSSIYRYNYFTSPVHTGNVFSIGENLKINTGPTLADNTTPGFTSNDLDGFGTTFSTRWFHNLNNGNAFVEINESTTMNPGIGFTMKGTGTPNSYNLIGTPNNGTINIPIDSGKFLLTGNPYPSTISVTAFNTTNSGLSTDGTIYLWDQPNDSGRHAGGLTDDTGGYATIVNGVTAQAAIIEDGVTSLLDVTTPSLFIKPGQGFVVYNDNASATVSFSNNMRDGITYDGTRHFFKTTKLQTLNSIKPIVRLGFEYDISNTKTFHRQLVTVLEEGSTLNKETGKDAFMFDYYNNDAYWVVNNDNDRFIITSVPPLSNDLELPIGIVLESEKEITFKVDDVQNFTNDIYILDKENSTINKISTTDIYTTNVVPGNHQNRFSLVFSESESETLLSLDSIENSKTTIYIKDKLLIIVLKTGEVKEIELFDLLGKKVLTKVNQEKVNLLKMDVSNLPMQIYIAKIKTTNGIITKNIFIN